MSLMISSLIKRRLWALWCGVIAVCVVCSDSFGQSKPDSLTAPYDEYRHFIMPTGKPINGAYLGFWELAFLQGGFGVGDVLSFSGGITLLPTVAF
ncbi:MAG: hypothetical protein ABI778_09950, partial [Ignavibacteriota bacterium]